MTARGIEVHGVRDFDLAQTLDCGQCFRWDALPDGSFRGVACNKPLRVYIENDTLVLEGTGKEDFLSVWWNYFDLSLDYGSIREQLSLLDETLCKTAQFAPGMRILAQDPWEALCSFIISQNNNIPRIKGIIARLCKEFGEPCGCGALDFTFPAPHRLAELTIEDLTPLRAGFRAAYLLDAAQKVNSGTVDLQKIKALPLDEARAALMQIKGVGPKVADCALLYGLHRLNAFPMDVWMKRAMHTLFPNRTSEVFGAYAGIAQQYIFHYSRMHPEIFGH